MVLLIFPNLPIGLYHSRINKSYTPLRELINNSRIEFNNSELCCTISVIITSKTVLLYLIVYKTQLS